MPCQRSPASAFFADSLFGNIDKNTFEGKRNKR
jgi:hypothetical protein